jgi:hypothetical protein
MKTRDQSLTEYLSSVGNNYCLSNTCSECLLDNQCNDRNFPLKPSFRERSWQTMALMVDYAKLLAMKIRGWFIE